MAIFSSFEEYGGKFVEVKTYFAKERKFCFLELCMVMGQVLERCCRTSTKVVAERWCLNQIFICKRTEEMVMHLT